MRTMAASLAPGPASVFVRTLGGRTARDPALRSNGGRGEELLEIFGVRFVFSGAKRNQSFSDSMRVAGAVSGRL